jgi:4-hydroxy-4-methyl-2-oxoglutarate aldolase
MSAMMQVNKLQEERDTISTREFPIPVDELLTRYEALYTPAVYDALREMALVDQALPHEIIPLCPDKTVAGIAFTIKSSTDPTLEGELDKRAEMLDSIIPYSFCVWETGGDSESAHWGEMTCNAAKRHGARAAVLDGGLRDTHQVLKLDFPVFYKYRTPLGSLSRCKMVSFQKVIRIGKVIIKPGDVVMGDIDGVIIVPRDIAYEVLLRAEQIRGNEKNIKQWIESGVSASGVSERGGYF